MSEHRLIRECKTMESMVDIFCHQRHGRVDDLCGDCRNLLEYSLLKLHKCSFGTRKPTCLKCSVHCYKAEMRDNVKAVMRYSGPRMLLRHPIMAFRHFLDGIQ